MYQSKTLLVIPNPIHLVQRLLRHQTSSPRNLLTLRVSKNQEQGAKMVSLTLGQGAGYKSGATAYLAKQCRSRSNGDVLPFKVGLTKEWKSIPWIAS